MAKLLSYFGLCPIADMADFMGITKDKEPGTVINTMGRNIVIITKLSSQKQLLSWTVLEKLSAPVVYNASTQHYVAVFGGNILKYWDENATDLKKAKKIKIQKTIKTLVSCADGGVLVVFQDGSVDSVDNILSIGKSYKVDHLKPMFDPNQNSIIKAEVFTDARDEKFLFLFTWNKTCVELIYSRISDDYKVIGTTNKIKLNRKGVKCVGYCISESNHGLFLLSIWSDKRMMKHEIKEVSEENGTGNFMEIIDFFDINEPLSVIGIAKNYIAIYGANKHQEGSSLVLYNIQYKLIEAKQYFKVYFNNSQMWTIDNNILLAIGQSMSVIPFHISEEQLTNIMGSKLALKHGQPIEKNFIDEDGENEMRIEFRKKKSTIEPYTLKTNDNLSELIPVQTFDQIWDKSFNIQDLQIATSSEAIKTIVCLKGESRFNMSESVLALIEMLENRGCSEIEITSHLIPILLAANLRSDLAIILNQFQTVSENSLVDCLKFALKENDTMLLSTIFAIEFDEQYMVQSIREKMTIEEDILVLKSLFEILTTESLKLDVEDETEMLLKWVACILDAHYSQFILSKSEKAFSEFIRWKSRIEKHINVLKDFNKLAPTVSNLAKGTFAKNSTQKPQSKWYNIQLIKLQ